MRGEAALRVHGELGLARGAGGTEGAQRIGILASEFAMRLASKPLEAAFRRHLDHMDK
ncbi:hypothetical protein D3C86_1979920 [compost metagenome]